MSRIGDPRLLMERLQELSEKIQRNNLSKNRFVENIRERLGVIYNKIKKLKLLYQECQQRLRERHPIDEDDSIEELQQIIRNHEKKNRNHQKEVALLEKEIERLQDEIRKKNKTPPYIPPESDESLRRLIQELREKEIMIVQLKEEIFKLTRENEKMIVQLREEISILTRENEQLKRSPPKYTPPPDEITFYKDQLDLRNKELDECREELAKIKKISGPTIDQNEFNRLVQENMRLKKENKLLRDNEEIYKQYYEEINEMITDVDNEFSSIMSGVDKIERELDIPQLRKKYTNVDVINSGFSDTDNSDDDNGDNSRGKPKNPNFGSTRFLEPLDDKTITKQANETSLYPKYDSTRIETTKTNFEIDKGKSRGGYTKKKRRNNKKRHTKRNKRNKSK